MPISARDFLNEPDDSRALDLYRQTLEEQHGLSSGVLRSMAREESRGRSNAVSPKGAQGLMQIMPGTAKELGVDPSDPWQATEGAARYLAQQRDRFGDEDLALAAYNAGPRRVQEYGGIPPFPETQHYVENVRAPDAREFLLADDDAPTARDFLLSDDGAAVADGSAAAPVSAPAVDPAELTLDVSDLPTSTTLVLPSRPADLPSAPFSAMRQALGVSSPVEQQAAAERAADVRLPQGVVSDLEAGRPGFSEAEFSGLLSAIERGDFQEPQKVRELLAGSVSPDGLRRVDEAILTQSLLREAAGRPSVIPGGETGRAFLGSAVDAATLNLADTGPALTGRPDIDRLLTGGRRAQAKQEQKAAEEHPVASFAGSAAGGAIPYAVGVKLLRGLRAARGLAPVVESTEGYIAEGAKLGGVMEPLRRPEGADEMTTGQEIGARAMQAAVGVTVGALLDFSVMGLGEFGQTFRRAMSDRKTAAALNLEAKRAGFDSPEEYVSALTTIERTPDGAVIKPNRELIENLPGEERVSTAAVQTDIPRNTPGTEALPGLPKPLSGTSDEALRGQGVAGEVAGDMPAGRPQRTFRDILEQADEMERLGRATNNAQIRQQLFGDALALRREAEALKTGGEAKLSPGERLRKARRVDPQEDDLITAIRKLGGIDTALETDWAGRLSHLPRRGFGLPSIERTRGGGRSLDDLAEALHEFGYLSARDPRELAARLSEAETGRPVWALGRQDFEDLAPARGPSDRDWRFTDDFAFGRSPEDSDFVIDTDAGTVIPGRPLNETDLRAIEAEIYDNLGAVTEDEFARLAREAEGAGPTEQSGRLPDAGELGGEPRVSNPPAGRAGDQSGSGEARRLRTGGQFELPGIEPRNETRQALADLQRAKDARRSGIEDVPAGLGDDLFSGRSRQADIADLTASNSVEKPEALAAAKLFSDEKAETKIAEETPAGGVVLYARGAGGERQPGDLLRGKALARISQRRSGSVPAAEAANRRIVTANDAAGVVAPFRKEANENLVAVVTDGDGNVLRVLKLAQGHQTGATVSPSTVAGSALNVPGGKAVWFAHNHPSGVLDQSTKDRQFTNQLSELLRGSGIENQGMLVVGPGGKHFTYFAPGGKRVDSYVPRPTSPTVRREELPVFERAIVGFGEQLTPVSDRNPVQKVFREMGDIEGVMLLDAHRRPVAMMPMSQQDMMLLRRGDKGMLRQLLQAIDGTNATRIAARVKTTDKAVLEDTVGNLLAFAHAADLDFVDAVDGRFRPLRGTDDMPLAKSTFYANPFLLGAKSIAKDIGLYPGRTAIEAAAGGALGAVSSDDEPGSAKWWLDVAKGATLSVAGFKGLRAASVTGKDGFVDRWANKVGDYIESLPLIGRGPEDLRDLKRKQQVMRDLLDRQTAEVGRFLRDQFTPAERGMMADLIEKRGIVKDLNLIHRQAQQLDDFITDAGERLKKLGMLPEDIETGGYLHRYYEKHLNLSTLFGAKKPWRETLSGSYTIARGTDETVNRNYVSPAAQAVLDELTEVRGKIETLEKKAIRTPDVFDGEELAKLRARAKELRATEFAEYVGEENGAMKSFFFRKDEVPRVSGSRPKIFEFRPGADEQAVGAAMPVADVGQLSPTDRAWFPRGTDGQAALLHRDWTEAERAAWGEIKDAGYRYVRGMAEVSHDVSLGTLFDAVRRRTDWVSDTPRDGWIEVPSGKVDKESPLRKYGALSGKWVRPDVWAGLKGYGRSPLGNSPAAKLYRGALAKWKLWHTADNPVTHFNNLHSNTQMLFLSGYGPGDVATAMRHMAKGEKSALWKEARDEGLFGTDWTSALLASDGLESASLRDLAEQLRTQPEIPDATLVTTLLMDLKRHWMESREAISGAKGPWKTGAEVIKAINRPAVKGLKAVTAKPYGAYARLMRRAYHFEDNLFKMAVYAAERGKGAKPAQALQAANRYFFDYTDVPEAIRLARDLPIGSPFISYTYFATQAVARNLIERPERALALLAGYEALNYTGMLASTDGAAPGEYWDISAAEETLSPPWDRGRSLAGFRNTLHLPSAEGYRLALGRAHVLGNPFANEAGGREKLPPIPGLGEAWGSSFLGGNPLHSFLDVFVNEDWKGKPIYHEKDPTDVKVKKATAYLYQAFSPSTPVFPGSYHQTKILEGLANDARKAAERGENHIAAPIVAAANAVADALGFERLTGLDRGENEILTRDAVLGTVGIKLRPRRFSQSLEIELSRLDAERKKIAERLRKEEKKADAGRIGDDQMREADEQYERDMQAIDAKEDALFEAEDRLRSAGLFGD
jgi:hypothetical protein